MKRSKQITLTFLISSVLFSCQQQHKHTPHNRLYMRADSAAPYNAIRHTNGVYPYYHFTPYGYYGSSGYHRVGYYNSRTYATSVKAKTSISRGGFGSIGRGGFSVGS